MCLRRMRSAIELSGIQTCALTPICAFSPYPHWNLCNFKLKCGEHPKLTAACSPNFHTTNSVHNQIDCGHHPGKNRYPKLLPDFQESVQEILGGGLIMVENGEHIDEIQKNTVIGCPSMSIHGQRLLLFASHLVRTIYTRYIHAWFKWNS